MSTLPFSIEENARRLAEAVQVLRRRLERFGRREEVPITPAPRPRPAGLLGWPFQRTRRAEPAATATTQLDSHVEIPRPPALVELGRLFGLSPFEQDILLLAAATELDTRFAGLCARAQDSPHRPYPTFALALALLDQPTWDALSAGRPLRFWRLIEVHQPDGQCLTTSSLRADERVVNYLKGLNHLDDRLAPYVTPLAGEPQRLAASQREVAEAIVERWSKTPENSPLPVVELTGADVPAKRLVAHAVARLLGRQLYVLPAHSVPTHGTDQENLSRLWTRESLMLPVALYVDAQELDPAATDRLAPLDRFLARAGGLVLLGLRETHPGVNWPWSSWEIRKPTPKEQAEAWATILDPEGATDADALAGQFHLNLPDIDEVGFWVGAEATLLAAPGQVGPGDLPPAIQRLDCAVSPKGRAAWHACCHRVRPRLDTLAQRIEPKAGWEDLVLPEREKETLAEIAAQVRLRQRVYEEWGFAQRMSRGFGISALFAGESGTGKTMACEVLARVLGLNLYRIDLSAVVSKYIGETEKNLRRVFDAAEDGGVILCFDECDALFGKRSEVKDSHDRYANIEINYLLQRLESFRGLAVLATNMKSAIDLAFMRRLRFVVTFRFPTQADRRRMWERAFPARTSASGGVPLGTIDYDRLAGLNLTGGLIHNAALNAAFKAAEAESPVTMRMILDAARSELEKSERPLNASAFLWTDTNGHKRGGAAAVT